jgi:hypothetical protein
MVVPVIVGGGWANTLLRQILRVNPLSQCFLFSLFFFLKLEAAVALINYM